MNRNTGYGRVLGACLSVMAILSFTGVRAEAPFIRGDVDGSGEVGITDCLQILGFLFLGSPESLDCMEAANANSDNTVDLSDAIFTLFFLFLDVKPPAAPFPACGTDPAGAPLGCRSHPACGWTNSIGMKLVYIPPGSFLMGSPDSERGRWEAEGPVHKVNISTGFYMGATEVTQGQYLEVMGTNPSYFNGGEYGVDLNRPVERVTWNDAIAFCANLSAREGREYRLPTEAQWEYACRAGTTTRFSFGDALECVDECGACPIADEYLWWCGNDSLYGTKPVGQKKPNPWCLFDMHGNVWEWCQDWWANPYPAGEVTNPTGPPSGDYRVLRGGDWDHLLLLCRSAFRLDYFPDGWNLNFGFRVVQVSGLPGE